MVGGEHSLQISAPQLLWFGIDSTLNIFPQTMTELINQLINYEGDCRTAPATPGLLNIYTYIIARLENLRPCTVNENKWGDFPRAGLFLCCPYTQQ